MKKFNATALCALFICSTIMPHATPEIFQEIRQGNKEALRKRLDDWQDCSQTDEDGNNALHVAVAEGKTEIVEMLTTESDTSGWNYWCSWVQNTAKLPDKDGKNKDGDTPLHISTEQEDPQTSEKLIEKGANPKITNNQGLTPGFNAVKKNKRKIIPFLTKYQLLQQKNNGDNALHFAVKYDLFDMITELAQQKYNLIDKKNEQGKTSTMLAAERNDATSLKILHQQGASLVERDRHGRQPIHHTTLAGNYEGTKYLLDSGVYVDAHDDNEDTALLVAASKGEIKIVDLFFAYKADSKKRNKQGKDIFILAVENKRSELIKRLKDRPDVNINSTDNNGRTAFMNATIAANHSMMRTLYDAGVDIYTVDNAGENVIHKVAQTGDTSGLAFLMPYYSSDHLDKKNHQGNAPVFVAIENGQLNMVVSLLHANVSLNITNNNGETIFHKYAQCKNPKVLPTLLTTMLENPLSKPNINTPAHNGLSAMHYASANNNITAMQELPKYGASYADLTQTNDTIAHTAAKYNAVDSLKHLKSVMPMMLQQRNKSGHTPFITSAAEGNLDALKLLFCEHDIISRDSSVAISVARANKHAHIVSFLEQEETKLMNICTDIASLPQLIKKDESEIQQLQVNIAEKDLWYVADYFLYGTSLLTQYSANELYYKTEAERDKIFREYTTKLDKVREKKYALETKYNNILHQEKQERQAREQAARDAEQKRQAKVREQLRKQQAEEARVARELAAAIEQKRIDEEEADLKIYSDQNAELKRIEKENEAKKAALVAQQQAILNEGNQRKAKEDAKHAAALEQQQVHVPMNLQASAPPMEEEKQQPLRCCICLGTEEEETLTHMPCDHCKKDTSSVRICSECLGDCLKKNTTNKQPKLCPTCGTNSLDEELAKKLAGQQ